MNYTSIKKIRIPLTKDIVFQYYFRKNKKVIISLLHSFLPLKKETSISDVVHLNPRLLSSDDNLKQSILDLKLKLNTGDYVNMEMQTFPESTFSERLLYYLCRMCVDEQNLRKGEKYKELSRCYSLVFTNFPLNKKLKDVCSSFSFRQDKSPHVMFSDMLRIIAVDLSRFREDALGLNLDRKQFLWCSLLKGSQRGLTEEELTVISKGEDMSEAVKEYKELSKDKVLKELEWQRDEAWRREQGRLDYARNEGLEKGLQEGKRKGLQEGHQEVALNMLKEKANISFISKVTGLSEKEIKKLSS